jgi:hypothetical protein
MECIRLLHPRRYNERERRFTSFAFRNSDSDGTLSIIDWACIQATGRSVGEHIRHHYGKYQNVVWEPPIFWKFDTAAILPVGQIKPDNSGGDDCHRVVEGVADQTLAAIIESRDVRSDFSICNNGGYRTVTEAEIVAQKKAFKKQHG